MKNKQLAAIIKSHRDLVTTDIETARGFILQAKEKFNIARPIIENANLLLSELLRHSTSEAILSNRRIRRQILSAAGLSEKAQSHLSDEQLEIILNEMKKLLPNDIRQVRTEIIYRYLLTSGDALGGRSRNITGSLAQRKLIELLEKSLKATRAQIEVVRSDNGKVQLLKWRRRLLLFDKKPKFIDNNVDVIMLNVTESQRATEFKRDLEDKTKFIALGELKGGIDPAGADEHWKTASTALQRIRDKFKGFNIPELFFAGAAIEEAMAKQIYAQLQDGSLSFAANYTSEEQLQALVHWLISL